jgi:DUF4097 and DUF4098 domain-containing protein YvlB
MDQTASRIARWIWPLVAALLLVSCINVERWGPRVRREREVELSASMPPASALHADTKDGSISVQGADAEECRLTAKIQVRAASKEKADEIAEAIQVRLDRSADGLEVVTDAPRLDNIAEYSVSLTLLVPRRAALKLTTGDGQVSVKDIDGPVEARTANGNVQIENVKGDIRSRSYDGAVTCAQIEARNVDLYTSNGNIRLSQAQMTSCTIEGANGLVYLADVQVDSLNVRTGDGGVRCQNVAAQKLDCTSSNGSVYITWPPEGPKSPDITVALTDGSITFVGVTDVSVVLDAFTNSGPIRAELPGIAKGRLGKSFQTTIGAGGGRLMLTTHDGSITIR